MARVSLFGWRISSVIAMALFSAHKSSVSHNVEAFLSISCLSSQTDRPLQVQTSLHVVSTRTDAF